MDISLFSGDSRNLIITVTDSNNKAIDLTGASIEYVLADQQSTVVLTKTVGSGIKINDPLAGQFTVSLTPGDTQSLNGTYSHAVRITLNNGNSSLVLTGAVTITKGLL